MSDRESAIGGAGPTGLALATVPARHGAAGRIIDRAPEFHHPARGKDLQALP